MTVATACFSSLRAAQLPIQDMRSQESCKPRATGAILLLGPQTCIGASYLDIIFPSGEPQIWDPKADGYARGEKTAASSLKFFQMC